MPRMSHTSGRGRGRSASDRGGSHSSVPSGHRTSFADMDDYRTMTDYESMPTTDSSHMASLEHPPTSFSGPPKLFLDGA
ncbi:hypothetical protein Dimus_024731, partial [Dionaea muscipula]